MAQASVTAPQIAPTGWPVDEDGKPMAVISFSAADLVPTVQYGNVTLGPASISRPCKDDEESIKSTMKSCQEMVEDVLSKERGLVQKALSPSAKVA